jgi:hypothetical protein
MAVNQFQHEKANKVLLKPGSIIPYTTADRHPDIHFCFGYCALFKKKQSLMLLFMYTPQLL